jgi:hypothetical protein
MLNTVTGVVQTIVANAAGAVPGCVQLAVANASNANPIVITTEAPHGLTSGSVATVAKVQGNVAANGTWSITVLSPVTFSIPAVGNGTYTSGGVIEGGDLGEIDAIIQANPVPGAVTEQTVSANTVPVTIGSPTSPATVYVQAAFANQAAPAIATALTNYQTNLPIGGLTLPGEGTNVAPYDEILGVMENAIPQIQNITGLLLNGSTADVPLGPSGVVSFATSSMNLNVVGV